MSVPRVVNDRQSSFGAPPGGRRAQRRARVRQALLDAALLEFAAHGIHAARLEDITDRADLGKGAFYNYFDSKVSLVAALVAQAAERLEREYLSRVTAPRATDRAVEAARQHGAFFEDHPGYLLLLHQARGLILLEERQARRLRDALADYLRRVGRAVTPDPTAAPRARLIEQGAAVAALVAGYRSFGIATARDLHPRTVEAFVAGGFAAVATRRARRLRPPAAPIRRARRGGRR